MGSCITVTAHKLKGEEWVEIETDFMDSQDYDLYGWLGNVRNFAKIPSFHPYRGLPDWYSKSENWGWTSLISFSDPHFGNHSKTWYTLDELVNFDYDQSFTHCREGEVIMTYRECFGEKYFEDLEKIKEEGVEILIMSWDT
jgi:hypothetical protein